MFSDSVITVLIVKLSSLGDVVQTIPVIHDILRHYPNARIDWVVEETFAPLLSGVAGIRTVIPIAQRRWRKHGFKQLVDTHIKQEKQAFFQRLHEHRYDAVIDAQGLIKSAWIARRAKLASPTRFFTAHSTFITTPIRATFGNRSESCGYEWPVRWLTDTHITMPRRIHAVLRTRLLCAKALGYDGPSDAILNHTLCYDWRPLHQAHATAVFYSLEGVTFSAAARALSESYQGEKPKRSWVVLVHGSSRDDNQWAQTHWIVLAMQLILQGYDVLLPHSNADELHSAKRIVQGVVDHLKELSHSRIPMVTAIEDQASNQISDKANIHILQKYDLFAITQLIQNSAAIIGLDTGLSHIAVALDKPCLQIFLHDRAWRAGPFTAAPHQKPYQASIGQDDTTTAAQVWQAWLALKTANDQVAQ